MVQLASYFYLLQLRRSPGTYRTLIFQSCRKPRSTSSTLSGTLRPPGQQKGKTTYTMVKFLTLSPPIDIIIYQRNRGSFKIQTTSRIELYAYVFAILKTWPNQEQFQQRDKKSVEAIKPMIRRALVREVLSPCVDDEF